MNGKLNLSNIAEQAIGSIIAALLFSIASQIIGALTGGMYPATVFLSTGATVFILALLLAFLWRPVRTFLSTIGGRAIAASWWVIRNWQVVLGMLLLAFVLAAIYGFTRTCWPAVLTLGLEAAFVLLTRHEQTVLTFSGKGIGDFSENGKKAWAPAVVCDPPFPDWIRLEGAQWVWIKDHPTDEEAQEGQTVWHRVRVKIPRFVRKLQSATLYFLVDDYVSIFVNEALVRRREKGGAVIALDVGNFVHPGENMIEMEIENAPMEGATGDRNPAGITFVLETRLRLF
jgi:hypothetical protein